MDFCSIFVKNDDKIKWYTFVGVTIDNITGRRSFNMKTGVTVRKAVVALAIATLFLPAGAKSVYAYNSEFSGQAIADFQKNNISAPSALSDQKYSKPMSRVDIAEVIAALSDAIPTSKSGVVKQNPFRDTQSAGVIKSYSLGYMNGKTIEQFDPSGIVTREEFAAILVRFLNINGIKLQDKSNMSEFVDFNQTSSWASDSVAYCVANGFIKGKNHDADPVKREFAPKDSVSTEEALTMLDRAALMYKWIKKSEDVYINKFYIPGNIECSVTSGTIGDSKGQDVDAAVLYIDWSKVKDRAKMEKDLKYTLEKSFGQSQQIEGLIKILMSEPSEDNNQDFIELNDGIISYNVTYGSVSLIIAKK